MKLTKQIPVKEIMSNNIKYLMKVYNKSRKEVCLDLDFKYTTFCDWVNGNSYPRVENLESLAYYFRLGVKEIFMDIEGNPDLAKRVERYARDFGTVTRRNSSNNKNIINFNEDENVPDYQVELIDGQYYLLKLPSMIHQSLVSEIFGAIFMYIKNNKCDYRCFNGSIGIKVENKMDNIMDPDIIVCGLDLLKRSKLDRAPDWIIEVASPNTREKDFVIKKELYEEDGVREYWVVNPMSNNTRVYVNNSEHVCVSKDNHFDEVRIFEFDEVIESMVLDGFSIRISDLDLLG